MRALSIMAAFLLLMGAFCGPVEEKADLPDTGPPPKAEGFPAFAFGEITEPEMVQFVKVLPAVGEQLETAGYKANEMEQGEVADALAAMIEDMGSVKGIADVCKTAGMEWKDFRETMYRVMAATAAIGIDMAAAMQAEMGGDTEEAKEMAVELEKAKLFSVKVPQANKDMVMAHMDELEAIGNLGGE